MRRFIAALRRWRTTRRAMRILRQTAPGQHITNGMVHLKDACCKHLLLAWFPEEAEKAIKK
jgi:hypothetical protein